jgi:hypothetical protein
VRPLYLDNREFAAPISFSGLGQDRPFPTTVHIRKQCTFLAGKLSAGRAEIPSTPVVDDRIERRR